MPLNQQYVWLNTGHNFVHHNRWHIRITSQVVYGRSCVIIWHGSSGSIIQGSQLRDAIELMFKWLKNNYGL